MKSKIPSGLIALARERFHQKLLQGPLVASAGVPSVADSSNRKSIAIAKRFVASMGAVRTTTTRQAGQTSGGEFENIVGSFIEETFLQLGHLRPGTWQIITNPGAIGQFEQYQHLEELAALITEHPKYKSSIGGDYLIKPDLVIARFPEPDGTLNTTKGSVVSGFFPAHSPLRQTNNTRAILHASISCKWTIRSDRSQNTRTEALNLMRNRKGTVPHAVAVTAEPLPSRIGSIAYGTGDLDCIYHIALPELLQACIDEEDDQDIRALIDGRRLRDISDLPLDLAT